MAFCFTHRALSVAAVVFCSLPRCAGGPPKLQGTYPGRSQWINGYGNEGQPMEYCPSQCTENSDFSTHIEGHPEYSKYWDLAGFRAPQYSQNTQQEIDAGFTQVENPLVHSGEATFCKKPYPVCDYPNGDVYVRDALQRLQRKTTNSQCHMSMTVFLCALYRRKCLATRDVTPGSPTEGNHAVWPVCWEQCKNAYRDCGFSTEHGVLMCGEYVKAGWVQYEHIPNCDNPAARAQSGAMLTLLGTSLATMLLAGFVFR